MAERITLRSLTSHVGVNESMLEERVSAEHINEISQFLPWKLVTPHLGLTETDISDVDQSRDESEKRRKALRRWKERMAFRATYKKLVQALLKIGYAETAEKICNLPKGDVSSSSDFTSSGPESSSEDLCLLCLDCKCNDCSVFSATRKECPKPHHDTVPILKDDGVRRHCSLDNHELQSQTVNITRDFTPLLSQTCSSFKCCDVRVSDVIQYTVPQASNYRSSAQVTQNRFLKDCADQIQQAQTMDDLFKIFSSYTSWYDPSLLEDLIKEFGDKADKNRLDVYKGKLSEYIHSHSVESREDLDFGNISKMGRKVMLLKVDKEWDAIPLRHIDCIHRRVADVLGVGRRDLFLCSIRRGCILLKFLITRRIARKAFPLSSTQMKALKKENVVMLKCGWYYRRLSSFKSTVNITCDPGTPTLQAATKSKALSEVGHKICFPSKQGMHERHCLSICWT